MTGRAVVTY